MKGKYNTSPLTMLLAAKEIFTSMATYLADFTAAHSGITEAFRAAFLSRIILAFGLLGFDAQTAIKSIRRNVNTVAKDFKDQLATFLSSISYGFRAEMSQYNKFINDVGLAKFNKSITNDTLFEISVNLTQNLNNCSSDLKDIQITPAQITTIIQSATDYFDTYQAQNENAASHYSISEDNQTELNAIYAEVKAISKLAQEIYSKDRNKAKLFTFTAVSKNYKQSRRPKAAAAAKPATTDTNLTDTPPVAAPPADKPADSNTH